MFCFVTLSCIPAFLGLPLWSLTPSCLFQALFEVWPFHVVSEPKFSPHYQYHSLPSPPDVLSDPKCKLSRWESPSAISIIRKIIIITISSWFAFSTVITQWVCFQSPVLFVSSTPLKSSLASAEGYTWIRYWLCSCSESCRLCPAWEKCWEPQTRRGLWPGADPLHSKGHRDLWHWPGDRTLAHSRSQGLRCKSPGIPLFRLPLQRHQIKLVLCYASWLNDVKEPEIWDSMMGSQG